ncbi:hypothetical protein ACFVVA_36965 [Kitasatospora sp. NPDC058048]|uniref:hypothetical protein n=1 Tax=Kitasatospora sp. NPDC058048 TaxID=3346313 RepID=UPI0036DECF4C
MTTTPAEAGHLITAAAAASWTTLVTATAAPDGRTRHYRLQAANNAYDLSTGAWLCVDWHTTGAGPWTLDHRPPYLMIDGEQVHDPDLPRLTRAMEQFPGQPGS